VGTTNGNGELLRERLRGIIDDPAALGMLLAMVYVAGALAQVAVGLLLDRVPLKTLYAGIVAVQAPLFLLAASAEGWALYVLMIGFMVVVFGAIPFTDAMIVRYVDDPMRSRVSGMRLAVAFGVSSLAVWLLGPLVKAAGFRSLLLLMAGIAAVTFCVVMLLPRSTVQGLTDEAAPGTLRSEL
jgi:MFS family permease